MKIVKWVGIVVASYVVVVLSFEAMLGIVQPSSDGTVTIRTFDDAGAKDTVVTLSTDDAGQEWLESGHHFRSWYYRAVANPDVEIIQGDSIRPYTAVPVNTPEAVAHVNAIKREVDGAFVNMAFWALKGFAMSKPIRLDPRPKATD